MLAIGAARGAAMVVLYVACLVSIGDTKPSRHAELAFAVVGGLTCVAVTDRFGLGAGFACWALVSVAFSLTSLRSGVRAVPLIPPASAG